MLVRQQLMLPDWLVEHYKYISKRYNISFSEMVRLGLCMHMGNTLPKLFPEHKCRINSRKLAEAFKALAEDEGYREQFNALTSEIYMEAKKAVQFREKKRGEE